MITRAGLRKLLMIVMTVLATLTGVKVVTVTADSQAAIQQLRDSVRQAE